jgi:hypothetical protein
LVGQGVVRSAADFRSDGRKISSICRAIPRTDHSIARTCCRVSNDGRVVPEFEIPQLREVLQSPYRVIYRIKPDEIEVIAVVHASLDFTMG